MKQKITAIFAVLLACMSLMCACSQNGDGPITPPQPQYTPNNTLTDGALVPTTTAPLDSEGTLSPEQTDVIDFKPEPGDTIFTVATAKDIMPVLKALLESVMLKNGAAATFVAGDATVKTVNAFIYAYAQANAYTPEGVSMSEFEVQEAINIAFGDAYTYDQFNKDAKKGLINATLKDGIWKFEPGETYAPSMTYTLSTDVQFSEDKEYVYTYKDVFDDDGGFALACLVRSQNNMTGFSLMSIKLTKDAPK